MREREREREKERERRKREGERRRGRERRRERKTLRTMDREARRGGGRQARDARRSDARHGRGRDGGVPGTRPCRRLSRSASRLPRPWSHSDKPRPFRAERGEMCASGLYGVDRCASGSYRGRHLVVERLLEDLLLPLLVQPEWLQGLQSQQWRRAQQAYPAVGPASAAAAARPPPY